MSTDVYGDEERIEWRDVPDLERPAVAYELTIKSGRQFSHPAANGFKAGRIIAYAVCKRDTRMSSDSTGRYFPRRVWFLPANPEQLKNAPGAVPVLTSSIRAGEPSQPATKKQAL